MRTTIRLPDPLYDQVRLAALSGGTTVTSFIEEALRSELRRRQQSAELVADEPFRLVLLPSGRGVQPGVDLDDNSELLDLMESGR